MKRLVDELVDERNERIKIIEQLEDRLQYTVLYKRYMKLMKIEDIAEEQHYSSRWILKVHSKGLNNIQNILNSSH